MLTLSCMDTIGIVHAVSGFLVAHRLNIVNSQQFDDPGSGRFFLRVQARAERPVDVLALRSAFQALADNYGMDWNLSDADERMRLLIMVSKFDHCLNDLLYRIRTGALRVEVPVIVSNHPDLAPLAEAEGIPFVHIPVTAETKPQAEVRVREIVDEYRIDLVVLARYMQILSDELCADLAGRAINIHHSFLPGFKGARPYHQAFERGVKLVGATAHYVTADLDEGPIIEQEVFRVNHAHSAEDLALAGRDAECAALARAVRWHSERRVLLNGARTVVFTD
ncbi:formyltetrahydrofolate deformylase [Sediminivirga luteola]|uniref:Formyltetrahydrofolate deformylase n=1 Tax=Sediminivirga luteola TaxID=1774748 RepID=A0A8J2TY56_9MICO|nr:formyltetrahydrofolate deformylase [Sediminivirga luteola]